VNILNIHGYGGNPHNAAYTALQKNGCSKVTAPAIDYDTQSPEIILERLQNIIADKQINLIIGTSLGGFYASVLSAQHNLPVMLVNPCLTPFLLDLLSELEKNSLVQLFNELEKIELSNVSCIVGDADELLGNHAFTEKLLGNARFRRIKDGKHSGYTLPLKAFFSEMLQYYMAILPLKEGAECISSDLSD